MRRSTIFRPTSRSRQIASPPVIPNSFSVLQIFYLDDKEAPTTTKRDIDDAIQKVLAVQSELMVYDSVATGLNGMYSKVLQQKF
jgi:hypothetical protein